MKARKDREILTVLRNDRNSAFQEIYARFYGMIAHLIRQNSGTESDAEDIFQDTVVVLYEQVQSANLTLTCTLKTYVYSIARNLWLKELRKRKSFAKWKDYEKHVEIDHSGGDEVEDGRMERVTMAIKNLGEKCRSILTLFYYHNKDMKDIAEELGYTNSDNAKNQKYKCMKQLKKMTLELAGNE